MMKSGKQLIAIVVQIFFCLCLVSLVACSGTGPSYSTTQGSLKAPPDQQVYRTEGGVQTLDPALADDLGSLQAIGMVFTGLVSLDDNFNVRPQMANYDLQNNSDGLTWEFHLKPNLKFSDGTPLTSRDVAFSINRSLQPSTHSPDCLTFLGIIEDADLVAAGKMPSLIGQSIFTPDDQTLTIRTAKQAPYFLSNLTEACAFPVEEKLIQKYGQHFTDHLNEGGGDGTFIISDYNSTHGIDFVPNPNYYGSRPQLRKVTLAFYVDSDSNYKGYQLGQVDMTPISITYIDTVENNNPDFHSDAQLQSYFYMMNYLTKPFDNIKIRQAFALAINRNTIMKILHGLVIPTYNIIPKGMPGFNPNLTGPLGVTDTAGDPALAKKLLLEGLHEEGWANVSQIPPITLTYAGYPHDQVISATISMWRNTLGINVTPNPIDPLSDYSTFLNLTNGTRNNPNGLQFWANGWGVIYVDPRGFTTQVFGRDEINNTVNYGQNNSAASAKQRLVQNDLEAADANFDKNQRYQSYQKAEQELVDDVAWMPIYQFTNAFLLKPYVKGLVPSTSTLIPPDDWARIYIAMH